MSEDMKSLSLDDLAKTMADCQPTSMMDQKAKAEFLRRQTLAIKETASATKKYTLYMFISVILLLISVLGSLVFSYLNYMNSK